MTAKSTRARPAADAPSDAPITGDAPIHGDAPITQDAPITGVARGGLGTGTALDDTQVWDTSALQAPEPVQVPEPAHASPPAARAAAAAANAAPKPEAVSAPVAAASVAATPVEPTRVRARTERTSRRSPVVAGLVAALGIAFLIGAGIVATQGNLGANGVGGVPPAPAVTATTQPAADGNQDDANGKDKCKGRGNDKCDRDDEGDD